MELLIIATMITAVGTMFLNGALRFRRGGAEQLRRRAHQASPWPAARRRIPFSLLPAAGICYLTAASMVATVAGLHGPVFSILYLVMVLALLVTLVVFMFTSPDGWAHWTHRQRRNSRAQGPPASPGTVITEFRTL